MKALRSILDRSTGPRDQGGRGDGIALANPESTRPAASADVGSGMLGGYIALIQHSVHPKSLRKSAFASAVGSGGGTGSGVAVGEACGSSALLAAGPLLARASLEEICRRRDGAAVYVSLLSSGDIGISTTAGSAEDGGVSIFESFSKRGAVVDLASDPFGWNADCDGVNGDAPRRDCKPSAVSGRQGGGEDEDGHEKSCPFVTRACIDDLRSVAKAIRRAASSVECRRSQRNDPKTSGGGIGGDTSSSPLDYYPTQPPIPVVFETLTPLLHLHGAEHVALLLKNLGRQVVLKNHSQNGGCALESEILSGVKNSNALILSPIIAPVLSESLRPSEHRLLEDISDATMTVVKVGSYSGANIGDGIIDVVRRGGGSSKGVVARGAGGKLLREFQPFRIVRDRIDGRQRLVFDEDETRISHVGEDRASVATEHVSSRRNGRSAATVGAAAGREVLKYPAPATFGAADAGEGVGAPSSPPRPRIYLEDDDPEFDDVDEEDPDDDLDL